MTESNSQAQGWEILEAALRGLPPDELAGVIEALRTYLHDLRGAVAQARMASSLLQRELREAVLEEDVRELLNVIDVASRNANSLLDEWVGRLDRLVED
jgi:hypothetical protein